MAKILGKDQATYAKERDGFLRDLQHFHETRGTPFKRAPTLGSREVDLYLLYSLVTSLGGWIKVNSRNAWKDLLPSLKIPATCVNGSVALKQIYLRYLDRWEKVHYLHEEADRGSDDDEESRHKRWSARALHSVPYTYNYNQHNIVETNREYNHLSTDLYKPSDYDRLALSLISPLPNEQDFAINVCTLLSNDGKHTLKLEKHPRIINYLLGHAGIFDHSSLRQLFVHFYNDIRKKPIHNFWKDVLESQEYLDLTNENKFVRVKVEPSKSEPVKDEITSSTILSLQDIPMEVDNDRLKIPFESAPEIPDVECACEDVTETVPKDVDCDSFKLNIQPDDSEVFCLRRTLGTQDYVGQRVLQIATILRNLSFIEENVPVLVKNTSFIRFLLLCTTSQWNVLRNLGMDMLGNIATEFIVRDLQSDLLVSNLLKIVTRGLQSQDRASCISSLEVLNKLSQNEQNEDILLRSLESHVYRSVCSFLTIHDVMLLIYTLECLYSLSSLGERSCSLIVNNHGVIDTLVSLVTVEGKSYGPKACIGMKLVETLPSGGTQTQSQAQTQQSTTVATTSTAVTTATTTTTSLSTPVITSTPVPKVMTPSTPVRPVQIAPQRLITLTPTSTTTPATITISQTTTPSMTPQQLIQQQHAHQQAIHENEQFALAWLRATYEPCSDGKVDHQELYKHYMSSCSKIGRRGVISPLHFPRCVRSVFGGTVGPNPMKPANPTDRQYYEGIKVRAQPLIISIQSSSNPKTNTTPPTKGQQVRRKSNQSLVVSPVKSPALTVVADNNAATDSTPISPASPILKAQLSAPPKQSRETVVTPISSKGDTKSQVMAHPHLSQALLGSTGTTSTTTVTMSAGPSKESQASQGSSSSLIKSLLATKVAARQQQQRLLAQQGNGTPDNHQKTAIKSETPKISRINGARQLFTDGEIGDPSISSTTQFASSMKGKKEPPQPPPPPLAPLSNNVKGKSQRIDNEDSDSIGNNSLASSSGLGTVGIGGISSTEEGDNSLTSFEGLLNGIPNMENPLNEDSNSKDSVKIVSSEIPMNKPLRLADLLEKKFEKSPPMLNGVLGKDLRLGEKTLDLVENHIEKALLSRDNDPDKYEEVEIKTEIKQEIEIEETSEKMCLSLKRPATEEIVESEPKKLMLTANNINGSSMADSPAPESVSSSSNGDEAPATVSTAAAKLFADMAADILEDEDEEQLMQEVQAPTQIIESPVPISAQPPLQQIIVDNNQQVLLAQPRQIIVSQPQMQQSNQMVISAGTQLKTQTGQTVIVQNTGGHQRPVMLQQANTSQFLLSQGLQGQMQIVASSQAGQYVLQTSGAPGTYMVAQPQTAVVHGQPQTVLVAQTSQQQGTGTKTIIILQQQPANSSATHHQKVVVAPQGQQVVVTQVPRPIMHTSSVTNNVLTAPKVIKSVAGTSVAQTTTSTTSNGVTEKKPEEPKKPKIIRDLTTPYVCEWGECNIETKFKSANEVYLHVCASHCPTGSEEITCQWDRCDNMKRKRFSLMTHLHDKHCNTEAMKQGLIRRKQAAQSAKIEPPQSPPSNPHPGYAPDAALHAIKRHALEFVNPKELQLKPPKPGTTGASTAAPRVGPPPPTDQDDNEGPVTKSIRLTASLILRNLVIYSSHCKRYLKSYESHLANVALSNVESSRTIAQVLYDMNDGSTHR
ncbi:AT-rich interactive domain-containing protein 2 isoform X2 [Anoplophora glabripennis]|uniref:AT-rich interactive domain-containing protein 2 isoform X2 n=1 Tax=Anoplophora glabripennis TaxID=217634 RepID=UPI000874A3E0|nr:AT-rich interactive domain-containing protein 2 isoform X2 [Anoplophora glabripennis]